MPRILIWQVITAILMITWVTLSPASGLADIPRDKWLHFGAGAGICASGYAVSSWITDDPWQRATLGLTLGTAAGAIKEWADYNGNGESSATDFAATLAGAALTSGILLIWDHLSPYKEKEKPSTSVLPSSLNRETASEPAVYQKHLRIWPSYEFELSQRISRHALQTGPSISARLSPDFNHRTLHGPRRALLQHQLFLH